MILFNILSEIKKHKGVIVIDIELHEIQMALCTTKRYITDVRIEGKLSFSFHYFI